MYVHHTALAIFTANIISYLEFNIIFFMLKYNILAYRHI